MAKSPTYPTLTSTYISYQNISALQCLLNYRNNNSALKITGSYDQATINAVIAYQAANSLGADGLAGVGTLSKLTQGLIVKNGTVNYAARAAQYLLNKFESISVDGAFGEKSVTATKYFQSKMRITSDGIIGTTSWLYLFGYYFYPVWGCDTATSLDSSKLQTLSSMGMEFVARYLPGSNYSMTASEKNCILANDFAIISLWESDSPTSATYFSAARGKTDADRAIAGARSVGQPSSTAIYFAIDYDATDSDIKGRISDYVNAIIAEFKAQNCTYNVGLYGSGAVLEYFRGRVRYTMLACSSAWRGYTAYSRYLIKQFPTEKVNGSFTIDQNCASREAGAWRVSAQ